MIFTLSEILAFFCGVIVGAGILAFCSATIRAYQQRTHETLRSLCEHALLDNHQSFLNLANSTFEKTLSTSKRDFEEQQKTLCERLSPIHQVLAQVEGKLQHIEKERLESYASLKEHLLIMGLVQKELREETGNLVKALKSPTTRGQWGEMQLRRVVEMAGMLAYCDFLEQKTYGVLRPDMVVRLPGNTHIIVDAKSPLSSYLDSLSASNEVERQGHLEAHARHVRQHMRQLSQKAYWDQFETSPEFVVMFLPGEAFFSAALEKDPSLIEYGVQEKVILATPTTLIALLRASSYGWRQETLAGNARKIAELGRELHKRLLSMSEHINTMGGQLGRTVESYNKMVGTFESRVLVTARKFEGLQGEESTDDVVLSGICVVPRGASIADGISNL